MAHKEIILIRKIAFAFRSKLPKLYYPIIKCLGYFKQIGSAHTIYITDSLGGSFKSYLGKNSTKELRDNLNRGLDQESKIVIDTICKRFIEYPDESNKKIILLNQPIKGGLLPVELPECQKR